MSSLIKHWPEYAIEATCLGLFMVSAATFATLLQHPASPLAHWTSSALLRRMAMGIAMGSTLVAIVYSPLGRRSGAHMNPALTLTFFKLGKVRPGDAFFYVAAQFAGGIAGILVADRLLRGLPADKSVNYVATVPGMSGAAAAFAAEAAISFGMMLMVLSVMSSARLARFAGVCAGILVALYITIEAPVSGMSMNPARTFGPAMLAHTGSTLWIYFIAPPAGMLLAAAAFVRATGAARIRCAKLYHPLDVRCIFRCGYSRAGESTV